MMEDLNPVVSIDFSYMCGCGLLSIDIKTYVERFDGRSKTLLYNIERSVWDMLVKSALASGNIDNITKYCIKEVDTSFISNDSEIKYLEVWNDCMEVVFEKLKCKASPSAIGALTRKINKLKENGKYNEN